ncbi:MAG TPA: Slp family lipoprotein [Candidatus Nitrosotalea sp.]|nr:Slp family lipoprotein [Candidatus Nitrosotalea sp.]
MYRWLGLALLLTGCATAFPPEVMQTVNTAITVDALRADPTAYTGQRVIVGGEVLSTQPRPGETEIELLARRLQDDGYPELGDQSPGRLLLRSPDFLDPAVYSPGRRVTVIGTVHGVEERKVGEIPYRYPVILVERIRLWPKDVVVAPGYYPGPYWPWSPWPYYGPYYDPYYFGPYGRRYPYGWW